MTEIYLIRHGETTWNKQGRLQGHLDSPLTSKGQEDAFKLLNYFQNIPLTALYSSDLGRAIASITPLAKTTALPVTPTAALRELSYAQLAGKTKDSLTDREKTQLNKQLSAHSDYQIGQGESLMALQKRIVQCMNEIAAAHPNQQVAIMSHGLAITMFLKKILDIPVDVAYEFAIDNGCVTHFHFDAGNWLLQGGQKEEQKKGRTRRPLE